MIAFQPYKISENLNPVIWLKFVKLVKVKPVKTKCRLGMYHALSSLLTGLLVTAWGQDSALEKQMTERDLEILQKLADVLKLSSVRSNIVSGVSEGMNAELTSLSDFLDVVAERRPQGMCEMEECGGHSPMVVGAQHSNMELCSLVFCFVLHQIFILLSKLGVEFNKYICVFNDFFDHLPRFHYDYKPVM